MAILDNFEDLHDVTGVDEGREKEATAFPVADTAQYNVQVAKVTRVVGDDGAWDEGKEYCRLGAPLTIAGNEEGTMRSVGYANFNVSHKEYRRDNGGLDSMSSLYGQLTKALREIGAINGESSVADVYQAVTEHPIRLSVTKNYRTQEGWRTIGANTPTDREAEYRKAGFDCRNFTNRILTYQE